MDRKSKSLKTRPKAKSSRPTPSRGVRYNEMLVRTRWNAGALTSNGSGVIAQVYDFSIQNSSEYTSYTSLFTQCKLVSIQFSFVGATTGALTRTRLMIGTNQLMTSGTAVAPTDYKLVQNLSKPDIVDSNLVSPKYYSAPVPAGLEFANITSDSPTTPTPWAGSPGCLLMYTDLASASEPYFLVDALAVYHLSGRQ